MMLNAVVLVKYAMIPFFIVGGFAILLLFVWIVVKIASLLGNN